MREAQDCHTAQMVYNELNPCDCTILAVFGLPHLLASRICPCLKLHNLIERRSGPKYICNESDRSARVRKADDMLLAEELHLEERVA